MSTRTEDVNIEQRRNEESPVDGPRVARQTTLTPSASALAASHLEKRYGRRRVVDDVGLHVEKGEVVGLLGPNGAGKTTTFYMIVGGAPDNGTASWRSMSPVADVPACAPGLGDLPQEPSIFRN